MLTTGLLSLSIHETLTFDGIEIALHPDLFAEPRQNARQLHHSGSSTSLATAAASGKAAHKRLHSFSDAFPDLSADIEGVGEGETGPPGSATSSVAANRKLEVGDMIEIKVWDPIEGRDRSHENSPRVFRRRSSPPSASVRSSGAGDQAKNSASTAIIEPAVSSDLQTSKGGTASISMQYSTDSVAGNDSVDQATTVKEGDGSTVSSAEQGSDPEKQNKITSPRAADTPPTASGNESSKPPPVPRPRLNTVDNVSRSNVPSKPNVVGRTRTSAPEEAKRSSPVTVPSSKTPFRSHSRDISDMTLDTVFGGEKVGDSGGFPPSALGTFSVDSNDDMPAEEDQTALNRIGKTHHLRLSFVMVVSQKMLTSLKGSARTQISMLRQVADLYNLSSYDMVTVNKVEKADEASALEDVSADFVTISFKEQFISRADMHYFQNSLIGRWIYEGERLVNSTKGITAHAREIRHKKRLARSGIVTSNTMITFRSRSARIVWLVQISSEMWDYASPYEAGEHDQDALEEEASSELYFDKFVSFMYRLFEKWQALEVTHSLTVIFFSRTYLVSTHLADGSGGHVNTDVYGRKYVDHFKTVIENETCADWDSLVVRIKRDFIKYPFEVGWDLTREGGRRPSTAMQGNLLEAINVTLNLLQYHYLDRDLHRTGNSIVVVSAGSGVFEVDRGLAGITYQRMMDQGIGSDMVSLRLPPLHTAPFFHYNNDVVGADPQRIDTDMTYHEVPHWMHLSFVGYDDATPSAEPFAPIARESGMLQDQQTLIEIGPNGFLLPRMEEMATPVRMEPPTVSSFSRLANDAASPKPSRSQTQQRRLISGRDFSDILEACRPSSSGYSAPSSLSSLLLMQASSAREKWPDRESKTRSLTRSPPLKEWGAVDYDEVRRRLLSMSSARTVSGQSLLGVGFAETQTEQSDSSNKSSPSSSFVGQFSASFFGRSPAFSSIAGLHGGRVGSVKEFRIHRSPSIVMESPDGSQERRPESNESLQSTGAEEASVRDRPAGSEALKNNVDELSDSDETHIDELRQRMLQYDVEFFQRAELKSMDSAALVLASGTISPPSQSPVLGSTSSQDKVPALVGGLGAALSQYQQHGSLGDNLSTMDDPSVKRVLSSGKMVGPHGQMMSAFARPQSLGPFLDRSGLSQSPYFANVGMPIESESPHQLTRGKPVHRKSQDGLGPLKPHSFGTSPPSIQTRSQPIGIRQGSSNRSLKTTQKSNSPTRESLLSRSRKHSHHRNKRILNPFKQKDEEEALAERSHNRRRWSHVFPLGEIEFKRNAGPNWKSLCQPAILPLTIDYLPKPQELADMTFSHWNKLLGGMEHSHYTSYGDLLMEMVRQRLIQEFQLVPPAVVHESRRRSEAQTGAPEQRLASLGPRQAAGEKTFLSKGSEGRPEKQDDGVIEHVLSMGYIVHVLKFDPTSENPTISVIQYNSRNSQQELSAAFDYKYFSYSASTQGFEKAVQVFKKYGNQYLWSRSDALVCDGEYNLTSEDMRFRRIMFALVPPSFDDKTAENEYIKRFRKLEEYLRKLSESSEDSDNNRLEIQVVSSDDEGHDPSEELLQAKRRRLGTTELMKRFTIHLRKGKRDPYEWMELAVQPKFNTRRTYRIIFNWLVASSSKVDSQVQLLQRRCTQYGLQIFLFPQRSITSNIFLNPLTAPWIHCVRDKSKASQLDRGILERDFVDDGIFMTEPNFLDCIEDAKDYTFPRSWRSQIAKIPARQFVHRTGTLFIRLMMDEKGWAILTAIENKGLVNRDAALWTKARKAFRDIEMFVVEGLATPQGKDSDS